ncbi:hypothetical protein BJ508DRAFT_325666 [Ascobolus immersus RN42]|uniref:CxC1-like cysteine cluster associated with KDZ transposases domain-containing protein n=1 Tax=Ascobolus immersus RN42 TaxID=1160509 RepID=A0A3N4IE31_ASCIM|nr:hypothetical protein BJ508DRAFT_325666 [Ascobolus immersus RN42]
MLSNPSTFGDVGKRSILLIDKNDYCERVFKFCKCEFSLIAALARAGYICGSPRDPRLAFSVGLLEEFMRGGTPKTTFGKGLWEQHRRLKGGNGRLPQYLTPFVRAVEQFEIVMEGGY